MAYKTVEDQKAASKRHYVANKSAYLQRNKTYRKKITNFVNDMKEKTPCKDCRVNYPYYVMDFDQIDGVKKLGIISYYSRTGRIGALKEEMLKCEIVCANCHRVRTHTRLQKAK